MPPRWISWTEALAIHGGTVTAFEAFLRRQDVTALRCAGTRLLNREKFLVAVDREFDQASAAEAGAAR